MVRRKIEEILALLRRATVEDPYDNRYVREVCIDCGKIIDYWHDEEHYGHITVATNDEHDGIGEWIDALEWVLREMEREEAGK